MGQLLGLVHASLKEGIATSLDRASSELNCPSQNDAQVKLLALTHSSEQCLACGEEGQHPLIFTADCAQT